MKFTVKILMLLSLMLQPTMPAHADQKRVNPEVALTRLIEGNKRYMHDRLYHPNRNQLRREAVAGTQNPFVVIVGCSDSRIPPEIIFDQGVGDIFVVRVAGNVVGPIELESINYAVDVLGASLVLVLGHENCGAINAVYHHQTRDIEAIAKLVEPAIKKVRHSSNSTLDAAIKENVTFVIEYLRTTSVIKDLIAKKDVQVVGGYYTLRDGQVEVCCGIPVDKLD